MIFFHKFKLKIAKKNRFHHALLLMSNPNYPCLRFRSDRWDPTASRRGVCRHHLPGRRPVEKRCADFALPRTPSHYRGSPPHLTRKRTARNETWWRPCRRFPKRMKIKKLTAARGRVSRNDFQNRRDGKPRDCRIIDIRSLVIAAPTDGRTRRTRRRNNILNGIIMW